MNSNEEEAPQKEASIWLFVGPIVFGMILLSLCQRGNGESEQFKEAMQSCLNRGGDKDTCERSASEVVAIQNGVNRRQTDRESVQKEADRLQRYCSDSGDC